MSNDLISGIERGEFEVEIYNSPQMPGKVFNKAAKDELIRLAKIGSKAEERTAECNEYVANCYVRKCPGRDCCRAYRPPIPSLPEQGEGR